MNTAIRVVDLCKVYKHYWGPRALLKEMLLGLPSHHALWALRNVSFQIPEGRAFGLIGDNGAGKSTLLKILAGTTFPSSGYAEVRGQVTALLEIGAGFHPEFSGRANIHFSGALLGFSRDDVRSREEEIIEFSGLREFIDRPVKTYSSGMYLRLGFSVATGFDPSVLIIDEALAVGDQSFHKKCTDRMMRFRQSGKTILFCSHNLYQVRTLCEDALWLHRGEMQALGPATEIVDQYTNYLREESRDTIQAADRGRPRPEAAQVCWIDEVSLLDGEGKPRNVFQTGDTLQLEVRATFTSRFQGTPGIGVALVRNDGVALYTTASTMEQVPLQQVAPDRFCGRIVFSAIPLLSGLYYFNVVATDQSNMQAYDVVERAGPFTVCHSGPDSGLIRLEHHWRNRG